MKHINMRYRLLSRKCFYLKPDCNYYWLQARITYEYKEDAENARESERIIERSSQDPNKWIAIVSNKNRQWKKPLSYKNQEDQATKRFPPSSGI